MGSTTAKGRRLRIQLLLILAMAGAVALLLVWMLRMARLNTSIAYEWDFTVTDNPLMGYAPDARSPEQCEQSELVFIPVLWSQWEPEQGKYDVTWLEETFQIQRWREAGKHAVLRFMCDVPGEEAHMDIPDWLFQQTGDGTFYSTALGQGYSPNYSNETLLQCHAQALQALGEYCSRDNFVSFVELGSLGHWGEWHASDNAGRSILPDAGICQQYMDLYTRCFPAQALLTRRSYRGAVERGMGVYNDMVGDEQATLQWQSWLEQGGSQETLGEPLALTALEDYGLVSPAGGELTSSRSKAELLGEGLGDLLASVSSAHLTFLGPNTPDLTNQAIATARESLLRRMGYRIYIPRLETRYDFHARSLELRLNWANEGNGGFFFDWPVTVSVYDREKTLLYQQQLDLDLRTLTSDTEAVVTQTLIPFQQTMLDGFYVGISITDPSGATPVRLAILSEEAPEWVGTAQLIYQYKG